MARVAGSIGVLCFAMALQAEAGPRAGVGPGTPETPLDYAVPRHVIAGGSGSSAGGVYTVSGTVGQPDADPLQPSTGGSHAITGGFWPGAVAPVGDALFANGFE